MSVYINKSKMSVARTEKPGNSSENKSVFHLEDNRPGTAIQKRQTAIFANKQIKESHPREKANTTLPAPLKSGIENLSGHSMDDVNVHYNSSKPAQLNAHAYAQGTDIHIAAGQEKHLPHEAWHVVQQKQGRVRPTMQMKGKVNINDDQHLEKEADIMGEKALSYQNSSLSEPIQTLSIATISNNALQRKIVFGDDNKISEVALRIPGHRVRFTPKPMRRLIMTPVLQDLQGIITGLLGKTYHEAIDFFILRIERDLSSPLFHGIDPAKHDQVMAEVRLLFQQMKVQPHLGGEAVWLDGIANTYVDIFDKIILAQEERGGVAIGGNPLLAVRQPLTSQDVLKLFLAHGDMLETRIENWRRRLTRRDSKSSNALIKRQKRFNDTGEHSLLMFTHTAPAEETTTNDHRQGKDVYPGKGQFNYFRTGDNKQSQYLKADSKKQFLFIKELYDFYKELDGGASFTAFQEVAPGVQYALLRDGRYNHSGFGAEVNSYTKHKLFLDKATEHKGELMLPTTSSAKKHIDTSNEFATHRHIGHLATSAMPFESGYVSTILQHCRLIVNNLKALRLKNFIIVASDETQGFFTYPCIIIEPRSERALRAADIQSFIETIIQKFNKSSKIKLYQRNSFGFLYPSIADLERSIRIWPGQVDPDFFCSKITNILMSYDLELSDPQHKPVIVNPVSAEITGHAQNKMIFSTLARAMDHIKRIYGKGGFRSGLVLHFLHQRIVSNLTKAQLLLQMREDGGVRRIDKEDLFLEAAQIIENLNEFGLQLIELQEWNPTLEEFHETIAAGYGRFANSSGFHVTGAALSHSGMQAGMIAMNLRKRSVFEIGPSYFEFPREKALNDKQFGKQPALGKTGHYDPAYNFTHTEELKTHGAAPFVGSREHQCIIIDITNIKPSEITGILARHQHAQSIFLYGSLSKHFQLGMDRFTLGLILELNKLNTPSQLENYSIPPALIRYFILMQQTHNVGLEKENQ